MVLNRLFLFCLFNVTIFFVSHSMQKPIDVFLQAEEKDAQEIQIPLESAKISSTINSLIEEQNDPMTTKIIVPLAAINSNLLTNCLIPCMNAQQKNEIEVVNTKIEALSLQELPSFVQAVNYLDIQPLFTKALEIAKKKLLAIRNNKRSITNFRNLNDVEHLLAHLLIKTCPSIKLMVNAPKILEENRCYRNPDLFCFTKDDRLLAAACGYAILLWDTKTGKCVKALDRHTKQVQSLCFSSDGSLLASGSLDGTEKIWDTASGICLHTLKRHICLNDSSNGRYVTFNNDGSLLATWTWGKWDDPQVYLWNAKTGEFIKEFDGNRGTATKCCFNQKSSMLVIAYCHEIDLWNLKTNARQTLNERYVNPAELYFSSDDKYLISGSYYGDVHVWDSQTGGHLISFNSSLDRCFLFPGCHDSLNNNLAIYRPDLNKIDIFDVNCLAIKYSFTCSPVHHGAVKERLYVSRYFDNKQSVFIACSDFGNIYTVSLSTDASKDNALVNSYASYDDNKKNLICFSEDGSCLAVADNDGTIRLFNFADNYVEDYFAHQLNIDQAFFLISFHEKFNHHGKAVLCPYGHDYKLFMSLDERIRKALWRFTIFKCSFKCKIGHYAKPFAIATGFGLAALGSYMLIRSTGLNKIMNKDNRLL